MATIDIITAIEESGATYIGIRHLAEDEQYNIGDCCRESYDWDYEYDRSTYDTDSPVELPGTCAYDTGIDISWDDHQEIAAKLEAALSAANYIGKPVIIGGSQATYGNDEREIIIEDAIVIAILD